MSNVIVTPGSDIGLFNFNATGAVSGGTGQYAYSWDFNGDDVLDQFGSQTLQLWSTTATATDIFSVYGNSRAVGLMVRDTQCNFIKAASQAKTLNIPRTPAGTPEAPVQPYYYIQGDVSGLGGDTTKSVNVAFTADEMPPDTGSSKYVKCSYKKTTLSDVATFDITAFNHYDDGTNPRLLHGLRLNIKNIADTGATGTQNFDLPDIYISNYKTSESSDQFDARDYNKSTLCPTKLHILRSSGANTCEIDGSTISSDVIQVRGEYSCPELKATVGATTKKLKIDHGYFYCQMRYTNQCPGSPGGGGGGDDPGPR
jgi:hypothetical protein